MHTPEFASTISWSHMARSAAAREEGLTGVTGGAFDAALRAAATSAGYVLAALLPLPRQVSR